MENIDKLTRFAAKPFKLISLVLSNNDIWIRDFGLKFAMDKETEAKKYSSSRFRL